MIEYAWFADKLVSPWGTMKNAFPFPKEVERKRSKCRSVGVCVFNKRVIRNKMPRYLILIRN